MLAFFGRLLSKKPPEEQTDPMKKFLIAGLGTIGPKYYNTRHNIGFRILDHLAEKEEVSFSPEKLGDVAIFKFKGRTFILLKPSTFMNLSGKAVNYWLTKEKVPLENLLVVTDDLNLKFGSIRVKTKGSSGGHNGLKDIEAHLGTTNYNRFRFGISDEFSKGNQVNYVLGKWDEDESRLLPERIKVAADAIKAFSFIGLERCMNQFNTK